MAKALGASGSVSAAGGDGGMTSSAWHEARRLNIVARTTEAKMDREEKLVVLVEDDGNREALSHEGADFA